MTNRNLIAVTVVGIGLYYLSKKGMQVIDGVGVKGIRPKVTGFDVAKLQLKLSLRFDVQNSNNVAVPYTALFGDILYGTLKVSGIASYNGGFLEAGTVTPINVSATIDLAQLGMGVVDLVNSGKILQQLKFKGFLHAKGVKVPVTRNII